MSPEQFLSITDLLSDAVLLVTTEGVIEAANRRVRELLGWKGSPPAGLRLEQLVERDPDTLAGYLQTCARSRELVPTAWRIASGDQVRKFRCYGGLLSPRTKTGPALVLLTLVPQDASNEPFVVLNEKLNELAREIERRKQTEEALRQHLRLTEFGRDFGLALSQAGTLDKMLRLCTDLMVQHLDAAFARIWVIDELGETLVLRASSGMYTHLDGPHSRVPVGQLKIGFIAASQQPHLTNQVLGDSRVNDQTWARREGMVAFAGYPLIVDGTTIGVMAMFSKKRVTDTVLEVMGSVASELAVGISRKQAEDALSEKAAALELANSRKNEFLAMLAHELRNPLAPIRSGLDLLESEPSATDVIPVMLNHVEHMVRIVDDLLDVSRIMRGRIEMRKQPVELSQILKRSIDTIRPVMERDQHQLRVSGPAGGLWINGDEVRLTQAVTNLLHNAIKYSTPGGEIQIQTEQADGQAVLRVCDNGIGIEPEFVAELFTLFAQAKRTLDRSQGGLGIGLTLVKQIVALHGGEVTAFSEGLGKGSVFTINLPLTEQPSKTAAPLAADSESTAPSCRVMVVDDNVASAKLLARLLEKNWSYQISIEHDSESAVKQAKALRPDIILLDIGLPGLSGYEVARLLRGNPQFADTFIVALTGYGTDQDRKKSAEAGINVHLVKPVSLEDLKLVFKMYGAATCNNDSR